MISHQSPSLQTICAFTYLSKVGNSSSVVAIHILKLQTAHHSSYGNRLSSCKLQACKTCLESRENTLCLVYSYIRGSIYLEITAMLIKIGRHPCAQQTEVEYPLLYFSNHKTVAVSDCLVGITCSFLCDNGFHIKIPHITNAI